MSLLLLGGYSGGKVSATVLDKRWTDTGRCCSLQRGQWKDIRCHASREDRRRVLESDARQLEEYDKSSIVGSMEGNGASISATREHNASNHWEGDDKDSWAVWNEYFTKMDEIVRDLHAIDEDILDAVSQEDYGKASALKRDQLALESQDTVLEIQRELNAAIEEERYLDAAALRDSGGARLLGWWVGREGVDDAQGHVIAVTRDFSRYVAHAFTGYTLARAVGWTSESSPEVSIDNVILTRGDTEDEDGGGTPVFEVFYRKGDDGKSWQHQATVFNSPVLQLESSSEIADGFPSGNVVSVEHGTDEDGTDFVKINLSGKDDSPLDDEDDNIRTIDDLVNSLDSENDISSDEDEDMEEIIKELDEDDKEDLFSALSEMSLMNLSKRVPAEIEWMDKDSFALIVDENKQKEIIDLDSINVKQQDQDTNDQSETLKEIETMVKAALSSSDSTMTIIDDIQDRKDDRVSSIAGLEGKVTYRRLVTPTVTTDVFQGFYLGSFGPHGPEIIEIRRVQRDGQEWVEGIKITGDINVPAGEISFKARVGRENKLSPAGVYPIEYGVQARYPGQGRVAREGYSSPKWVDGELLTLTKSNSMTRGAEVGFVFNVDASKKFLLLFERIDDSIFV